MCVCVSDSESLSSDCEQLTGLGELGGGEVLGAVVFAEKTHLANSPPV